MTARRPALGLRRSWSPASLPRFSGYVSEFIDIFSIGAARFEKANAKAPCIDEIDVVVPRHVQTINQLIREMDGFCGNNGVMALAATNRLDVVENDGACLLGTTGRMELGTAGHGARRF
jgi:ATP-dependent Zn protease